MTDLAAPGLLGAFPATTAPAAVPPGTRPVWPDRNSVRGYGNWRPGELRTVAYPDGQLVVFGQCFASNRQVREDFRRALDADRPVLVTRWPGSYLAIVVRLHDLTAFVDLAGQYPVYHRSAGGRTVLGTHAGVTVRAAGLPPEPDELGLAAGVFCPSVPALADDRSPYRGLHRLGGGRALRVDLTGRSHTWTYETLAPDPGISLSQAAEGLRTALNAAVRARTAQPLTADFSGGLDSTSVAFLAAAHSGKPLPVFTYHHPEITARDLPHAQRHATLDEHFRPSLVEGGETTLTYQGLDGVGPTDVPDPGAVTQARTRLKLRQVAETGGGVHLGGEGADALLVAAPGYLGDLARSGALGRLRNDCHRLGRDRRVSPVRVFARSTRLSMTPFARALNVLARRFDRPLERGVEWLDAIAWWPQPGAELTWLAPGMRRELAEFARGGAPAGAPGGDLGVGDSAALTELRTAGTVQRQLDELARPAGVWAQAPFLDNDVVRACLALPAYHRADPAAHKPLLGRALAGQVPEVVLSRRTKGNYSAEDYRGIRRAAPEVIARVSGSPLVELGIVDPARVRGSVSRAIAGLAAPFPALNRLLAADLWLRGLDVGRRRP